MDDAIELRRSVVNTRLSTENRQLHQKLSTLLMQARDNEQKMRKFQALELKLIGINALGDLINAIVCPERAVTSWDMVSLVLFDPGYEIQRMMVDEGVDPASLPQLVFVSDSEEMATLYPRSLFPVLGAYRADRHQRFFPHVSRRPASVAMLPLVRSGRLIGSLNIGSYDGRCFVRGVRADFLEHFAAVVAICLENSMNLARLKRQGLTDTLTAINNRRFFDQRLSEEVEVAGRSGNALSCMLLDVDHFKRVNDTYGHQVGDKVLREVAAVIRTQLRSSDVLSRYGGEEFAALLANTGPSEAAEVAERVRAAVAAHVFESPEYAPFAVTISIGIATFCPEFLCPGAGCRMEDLLVGAADQALYAAKGGGRDCAVSASLAVC